MTETKAAFAERTVRSLKNIFYHFTVTWKIMETSAFTNCLKSSEP